MSIPIVSHRAASPRRAGFTLIELLTVIAIIGILAAIIIPVVGKVRTSAKRAQGISNLRQVVVAGLSFAQDNRGRWFKSDNENGEFYSISLTRYVNKLNGGGTLRNSEVFYDPLLPNLNNNNFHFAAVGIYFLDVAGAGLKAYNDFNRVKAPAKTVFFADNWTDRSVTERDENSGSEPPNWSVIQDTGTPIWSWPGYWGGAYTPNTTDGRKVPGPGYGTSKGQIDLERDPGQAKLGFFDGHVAIVKRVDMKHSIFDPRYQ